MKVFLFILINLAIFLTHGILAFRWMRHRDRSMSEIIIAGIISSLTQVVVTVVILGLLIQRLYVTELFGSNIAICVLFLVLSRTRPGHALRFLSGLGCWVSDGWKTLRSDAVVCALGVILFLLFLWLLFLAILVPPYSWDSMAFHLTAPVYWLQEGRMGIEPPYPHFDTYPRNISCLYFLQLAFLRNDIIVNCTNLVLFIPTAILSIFVIARHMGRKRASAILAGMLFFTFPIVIHQSTTCYIDLGSSCLFLAALAFLLKPRIEFSDVIYGGLGLGLFVGSKGNAPFFIVGAMIPIIIYHLPHLWRRVGIKRFLGWILVGLLCIMLTGAWVYADNWVRYGNPGHPFQIELFGVKLFRGEKLEELILIEPIFREHYEPLNKRSELGRIYYSWSEPAGKYVYDVRVGGFGPGLFVLLLPCMAASLLISLVRHDGKAFFTFAAFLLAFWFFPQGRFWVRYNIFAGAVFCLAVVYIIDLLRMSSAGNLLKGVVFSLAIITLFFGAAGVVPESHVKYFLSEPPHKWHSSQFTTGGGFSQLLFRKINALSTPGTCIAHDWTFLWRITYPLWNHDFSNRVVFIDYEKKNKTSWLETIDKINPDMIVIGTKGESFPWATSEPGRFKLLQKGRQLSLFRFKGKTDPGTGQSQGI